MDMWVLIVKIQLNTEPVFEFGGHIHPPFIRACAVEFFCSSLYAYYAYIYSRPLPLKSIHIHPSPEFALAYFVLLILKA